MPIPRGKAFLSRLYWCSAQLPVISERDEAKSPADRLECLHYRSQQTQQHSYRSTNSYQCIMVETVGYGPGLRPSWNKLSAGPLSWTHKTTIPKGCLSSLWYRIQFPLFSLLYSLTHMSLQPRVVNLLSFICWPRHFHVWTFLSNCYFILSAVPLLAYIA